MKTLMIFGTGHGGMFFTLTYVAAFLIAAGIMIFYGWRRGYPFTSWLLILVSGVVFFITGDKIATYSANQWQTVINEYYLPVALEKNALGGIIGLFTGILFARIILGFKKPVFDSLAVALPVSLAISRIGCLAAGCCFGNPTSLPFGIRYDGASAAWHAHMTRGMIDIHEPGSLAVHPVQLYQVFGCLVIAFIVWRTRNHWKANGSLFLFSILCYGFFRFFIEFLVDPASNSFAGSLLWGMNLVQWLIMIFFLPGLIILFFRELSPKPESTIPFPGKFHEFRQLIMATVMVFIIFGGRKWFDLVEYSTMLLFFIPVLMILIVSIYRQYAVAGFRWVFPVILVCSVSFMAQKSQPAGKEGEALVFTDVGLIGLAGRYFEDVYRVERMWIPGNCGIPGHWETNLQNLGSSQTNLWQGGIDVSHNKWVGKYKKSSIGIRGYIGSETGDISTDYPISGFLAGISPYVTFDWHYVGFGGGITVGLMKLPLGHKSTETYNEGDIVATGYNNFYVFPALSLRLGPSDILYAEGSFPGMFPSTAPYPLFKAGIGSGLGKTNGTKAAIGYCDGIYAQVVYPIQNKVVLEALYADNLRTGDRSARLFSFGIHYRFVNKSKSGKKIDPKTSGSFQGRTSIKTLHETIIDIDGNTYNTLSLGNQVWMSENLKVTRFNDGSEIHGANTSFIVLGGNYDWFAVTDGRKLCPAGWHVPSIDEWVSFLKSIGGENDTVKNMTEHFSAKGKIGQWWSSTELDAAQAQSCYLNTETIGVMFANAPKTSGLSVRCLRD